MNDEHSSGRTLPELPTSPHSVASRGLSVYPARLFQLGDPAHNLPLPRGKQQVGQAGDTLCATRGRHCKHGRHRAVRSRCCHFHRPGQPGGTKLWPDSHHQVMVLDSGPCSHHYYCSHILFTDTNEKDGFPFDLPNT